MTAAVVTGLGIVAPNGIGTAQHWASTLDGFGAIGPVSRFDAGGYPCRLAGEVRDFVADEHIPSRLLPQTDHMTRLAMTAADAAITDAGLDITKQPEFSTGVITANAYGGFEFGHHELENLWRHGPSHVSAYQSFAWFYAVNTGQISIRHGLRGPSGVLVTDQAGGLDAVAQARRQIRRGTSTILTGGCDSAICPWGWVALMAGRRMSPEPDPAKAYVPFDRRASGYVAGEGGAILVLEDEATAHERGATVYGRIAGCAATFDPKFRPESLSRAITAALADAGQSPSDVDAVFADGAGSPDLDRSEAAAISAVFGRRGVPVTVPKTMLGRLAAGAGALDLAVALLALRDGIIPPTINVTDPDEDLGLDLVLGTPRRAALGTVLVIARGAGGFHSVMVARHTP
jgi:act minimal PKS chain-length factor (CLF/KS beta)